jgi:hypothetical protein
MQIGETNVRFFYSESNIKSERMRIIRILNVRAPIDLDGRHPGTTLIIGLLPMDCTWNEQKAILKI